MSANSTSRRRLARPPGTKDGPAASRSRKRAVKQDCSSASRILSTIGGAVTEAAGVVPNVGAKPSRA